MKERHLRSFDDMAEARAGRRWNNEVYPVLRDIIQMTN
jgi:hypothetical protein